MTTGPSSDGWGATGETSKASVGQLVAAIKDDLSGLVRDEIELAKAELREDAKSVGVGGVMVVVAGVLAVLAIILLSVALAYGISALGLGPGWAFLIVAGFYLLLAAGLIWWARSRFTSVHGPVRARKAASQAAHGLRTLTSES